MCVLWWSCLTIVLPVFLHHLSSMRVHFLREESFCTQHYIKEPSWEFMMFRAKQPCSGKRCYLFFICRVEAISLHKVKYRHLATSRRRVQLLKTDESQQAHLVAWPLSRVSLAYHLVIDADLADPLLSRLDWHSFLIGDTVDHHRGQHLKDAIIPFAPREGAVAQCLTELWRAVTVSCSLRRSCLTTGLCHLSGHLCPGPQWNILMPKLRGLYKVWLNLIELHTEHSACKTDESWPCVHCININFLALLFVLLY